MLSKYSVEYSSPQIGQRVTASVVIIVTSTPTTPVMRLDLRNDSRMFATWQEGGWTTWGPISPGTWAISLQSIPVPGDWANGDSLSVQLVLEGQGGAWDSKSGLIIGGAVSKARNMEVGYAKV